jgi:hypothetical protein
MSKVKRLMYSHTLCSKNPLNMFWSHDATDVTANKTDSCFHEGYLIAEDRDKQNLECAS